MKFTLICVQWASKWSSEPGIKKSIVEWNFRVYFLWSTDLYRFIQILMYNPENGNIYKTKPILPTLTVISTKLLHPIQETRVPTTGFNFGLRYYTLELGYLRYMLLWNINYKRMRRKIIDDYRYVISERFVRN